MKKNYTAPGIISSLQMTESVICASGVTGGGMGYGGEDDGTLTPSARDRDDFEDEEINEEILRQIEQEDCYVHGLW